MLIFGSEPLQLRFGCFVRGTPFSLRCLVGLNFSSGANEMGSVVFTEVLAAERCRRNRFLKRIGGKFFFDVCTEISTNKPNQFDLKGRLKGGKKMNSF